MTGLPGSGKSTLANAVVAALRAQDEVVLPLDGDDLRPHLAGGGYGDDDRRRFYAALAHLAQLGARGGAIVVVSATAQLRSWRDAARRDAVDGGGRFIEVYMSAGVEVCAARDPKGLYRQQAIGAIAALPGVGSPYEPPLVPELCIGPDEPIDSAAARVLALLAWRPDRLEG
ncbi:MAG: adenylyl-sulfate kinase [Myxococcota bacterium]